MQHIYIANEGRDKPVGRAAVDLIWGADLANATLEHDGDPIRQAQGFALIVGYEDRGHAELALDLLDFNLHRRAQISVERRKRLVEQQYLRRDDKRASQRHTLLLTARKLVRPAIFHAGEPHERERLGDPTLQVGLGDAPHPQTVSDIVRDAHVREQRIALEHHPDLALVGRNVIDTLAVDLDLAAVGHKKPGDQIEQRGLAASRWPEQGHELAAANGHRGIFEGDYLAKPLACAQQTNGSIVETGRRRCSRTSFRSALSGEARHSAPSQGRDRRWPQSAT